MSTHEVHISQHNTSTPFEVDEGLTEHNFTGSRRACRRCSGKPNGSCERGCCTSTSGVLLQEFNRVKVAWVCVADVAAGVCNRRGMAPSRGRGRGVGTRRAPGRPQTNFRPEPYYRGDQGDSRQSSGWSTSTPQWASANDARYRSATTPCIFCCMHVPNPLAFLVLEAIL